MTRLYGVLKVGVLLIVIVASLISPTTRATTEGNAPNNEVYLPLITNNQSNGFSTEQKFIGIYMQHYWTDQSVAAMTTADNLAGKKHSVSAWFISLQDIAFTNRQTDINMNNFYRQMEALWKKGYISFINLQSAVEASNYEVSDKCKIPFNAYDLASGACDAAIQKMADLYKQWISTGGGRKAFLAPLPEMNGMYSEDTAWTSYAGDPNNYKLAYQRIQNIFAQKGVSRDQVWWVFAPNGWSIEGHEFEKYYPGDTLVDIVGFSSYNYGYCYVTGQWARWENYDTLYGPYISRINAMAPNKPVVLSQTGTTSEFQSSGENNVSAKNAWLKTNFEYISHQPQVIGILYYDYDQTPWECFWKVTEGGDYTGYSDGASFPEYRYLTSQDLNSIIP